LLIPDDIWLCCHIGVSLLCSFPVPSKRLYHTSGRKLFSRSTKMTGRILCNLSFLYNKKRHGRILFFHTYYLFLYSTEYTFFSIICVSCTYFPLKANCIHSIHAYHLYLILRPESAASPHGSVPEELSASPAFLWKIPSDFGPMGWITDDISPENLPCQICGTFFP